jgi:hypothetical protein
MGLQASPFASLAQNPTPVSYDAMTGGVVGVVFFDQNGAGQLAAGAAREADHVVFLDRNGNDVRDDGEPATLSNAQGQFLLDWPTSSAPLFAAPLSQFNIPIEKVTTPLDGTYSLSLRSRQAVIHVVFGVSRFEA